MPIVVRYLNPTANKALHVGHLRNAVVGEAIASALEFGGHDVIRQVLIEDVGIFMSEACLASSSLQDTQAKKYDAVVGEVYSRFRENKIDRSVIQAGARHHGLSATPESFAAALNEPASRESGFAGRLRNRVMNAQGETLMSLGIRFDHVACESDELPKCMAVIERLSRIERQRSWLATQRIRLQTGHIVNLYDAPAVPSENLLLLSFVVGQLAERSLELIVPVAGSEWERHMGGYVDLLSAAYPEIDCSRYSPIFTGLITQGGQKLSSRFGPVLLVDELIERISSRILASSEVPLPTIVAWMVSVVLKFPLLLRPIRKEIELSEELIHERSANAGWIVAEAIRKIGPEGAARFRAVRPAHGFPSLPPRRVLSAEGFAEEARKLVLLADRLLSGCSETPERFVVVCRRLGLGPPTEGPPWKLPEWRRANRGDGALGASA